jgi:hypothetical protein
MDSIQRLRHEAAAAGTLWSNPQQRVTTERQGIVIDPVNPEFIYPPVYRPAGVYGPWPYPDYPPLDISPAEPEFGLPLPFGIGFGVGFAVVRPLWRWCAFDWGQRRIQLDLDRFNAPQSPQAGNRDEHLAARPVPPARRARLQVFHGSAISAATIPRGNMPSAAASVPTAMHRSAPPALAPVGQAPTAVLRSPPSSFAPVERGLQDRNESRPGLASRHLMMPPIMPRHLSPSIMPRTVARPTASATGGAVLFGGTPHR